MTKEFIKNPFINMNYEWSDAKLIVLNKGEPGPYPEIADKTIAIDADILEVLDKMVKLKEGGSSIES